MQNISLALVVCIAVAFPLHGQVADKSGVTSSVISLPSGAGSIEGLGESFEPQLNTGGSSYGVSVALPPGRAGLTPSVRLGYSSFSGNGITGIGWSLGFQSIKRQTDKGFPEYDNGDTFVFEGEELVPLTNAEQDWRCENERGFQRIRQLDADTNGTPDAWEVTGPDGTKHTFGKFRGESDRWSVVEHPEKQASTPFDRTYCWMIDTTTDLHGNRIEYEYTQGTGVLYPSRITYSHLGENAQEVLFFYEDRADAFDDYRPTFSALLDRRLTRIEVRSQGQLVRAYNLSYSYEPGDLLQDEVAEQSTFLDLGVTLLKRVVQVDNSGNDANFLPPLIFTYSGLDLTQAEERSFAATPELDLAEPSGRVQLADVDGDALPDLFTTSLEGAATAQRVALNRGETRESGSPKLEFAPSRLVLASSEVDLGEANVQIHDPKGKGLVDLSCLVDDGFNKRLDTFANRSRLDFVNEDRLGFGSENVEVTVLQNPPDYVSYSSTSTRQMDVNFDKKGDFVNLEPGFGAMTVNSFYIQRDGTWAPKQTTLPASYPLANTFADEEGKPNPCVHLADMNGDRMLDLVCLDPLPSAGGQRISVSYWPLCGLGRYAEERTVVPTSPDTFDIGTVDLRDVFLEDFTGDGLADILILEDSSGVTTLTLRVNIAGQRWSPPYVREGLPRFAPRDETNPTVLRLADLNANGSVDLLFRNTAPQDDWTYLELLPTGQPSLLSGIDNSLGKRTAIVYGAAAEDEQEALAAGHPWRTFAPIPLQVVRQIRTSNGLDLNGDGEIDNAVAEFSYRDPFYDGFEREFRGFSFAQRVDYGDDFLFDKVTGLMNVSSGWDPASTPTGQVSGPSLVTRFRYHTGASDQKDNDDYGGTTPSIRIIDEITEVSGSEEEALKGLQLIQETVDPVVLHAAPDGGFHEGSELAATAETPEGQGKMTPDAYVYSRTRQEWIIRRLYRPAEALPYLADLDSDGVLEDYRNSPSPLVPAGRFAGDGVVVVEGNGRSVSFVFAKESVTELHEANGLLSTTLGYPAHPFIRTLQTFDYDDYGNQTILRDFGVDGGGYDDERFTTSTFAHGGNALSLWVINKPDTSTITDEDGAFVARQAHFYDGEPFVGVKGQIQDRALLSRTQENVNSNDMIEASRQQYDAFGNIVESRDPVGNIRRMTWDPVFSTFPIAEALVVGEGKPDLVVAASYDYGFAVMNHSIDFNDNLTTFHYDSFARPVKIVRPGDTIDKPTEAFDYLPADPIRGNGFIYDLSGNLTLTAVPIGSASRVTTRQREIENEVGEFISATYSDGLGKELATIEEGEISGTWVVKTATSYNLRMTPQSLWLPFQISSAELPSFTEIWPSGRPPNSDGINPEVVSSDLFYDPNSREIRSVSPPEEWGAPRLATSTRFLPLEKQVFDREDLRVGSPYFGTPNIEYSDGLDRLIAVEEIVKISDTGILGPLVGWRTQYTFDLNNQLIRTKDSQNNVKTMTYDALRRMTEMNDPNRGKMSYVYDDASNLLETRDAKDQRIVYTYDGVNRIKTEDYQDGGAKVFDVEYFYDTGQSDLDLGDGTTGNATNTKGQLAYVKDLSGETHFSYDSRIRQVWEVKRVPDHVHSQLVSYKTDFVYDSLNRLVDLNYPDGDQVSLKYNSRNLLTSIHGASLGDIIGHIDYRPSSQVSSTDYGNDVKTSYTYDPRLRMTNLKSTDAQELHLIDFAYTFDGASNIERIEDRRNLVGLPDAERRFNTQEFSYDSLYRVTRAEYPILGGTLTNQINYRYDRIGNMLEQSSDIAHEEEGLPVVNLGVMESGGIAGRSNRIGRGAGDSPGPHALSSISGSQSDDRNFEYDDNGNMMTIDGLTNTWDFQDRLIQVESAHMVANYVYDYTDRRVSKTIHWKNPESDKGAQVSTLNPDWRSTSTHYINKYFELRDHDAPVKYVWNGETRVARVTASMGSGTRIQRLRMQKGWNLVSLTVGGQFPVLDPDQNSHIGGAAYWSNEAPGNGWLEIDSTTTIPAGSSAWINAFEDTTIVLTGIAAPQVITQLDSGSQFIGNTVQEPFSIDELFPSSTWIARYDSNSGRWKHRYPAGNELATLNKPEVDVLPGESFWISEGSGEPLGVESVPLRVRYYLQDHLGSTSVIADRDGNLVEETANYVFGNVRNSYKTSTSPSEPYGFTQKEEDTESDLHYFEARFYSSSIGRFSRVDPISANDDLSILSSPQRLNGYSYSLNNPIVYTDPTGLQSEGKVEDGANNECVIDVSEIQDDISIAYFVSSEKGYEAIIQAAPVLETAGLSPKEIATLFVNAYDQGMDRKARSGTGQTARPGMTVTPCMRLSPQQRAQEELGIRTGDSTRAITYGVIRAMGYDHCFASGASGMISTAVNIRGGSTPKSTPTIKSPHRGGDYKPFANPPPPRSPYADHSQDLTPKYSR